MSFYFININYNDISGIGGATGPFHIPFLNTYFGMNSPIEYMLWAFLVRSLYSTVQISQISSMQVPHIDYMMRSNFKV